jgi:hypothetical protein
MVMVPPLLPPALIRRGARSRRVDPIFWAPMQPVYWRQWRRGRYHSLRESTTIMIVAVLGSGCPYQRADRAETTVVRVMGVGSGDAARERFPLDEADPAPPCMRNRREGRLWVDGNVGFGAGASGSMGSGGVLCREHESQPEYRLDTCEGVGEVSPGECRRDLWPDL